MSYRRFPEPKLTYSNVLFGHPTIQTPNILSLTSLKVRKPAYINISKPGTTEILAFLLEKSMQVHFLSIESRNQKWYSENKIKNKGHCALLG